MSCLDSVLSARRASWKKLSRVGLGSMIKFPCHEISLAAAWRIDCGSKSSLREGRSVGNCNHADGGGMN